MKIKEIYLKNFKSVKYQKIEFDNINILIGGNGAGKSNLISFFKLLNQISNKNLDYYIKKNGGADSFLYYGRKSSNELAAKIEFYTNSGGLNAYEFILEPNRENSLFFKSETAKFFTSSRTWYPEPIGNNNSESKLSINQSQVAHYVNDLFNEFEIYHFHDTSETSLMKSINDIADNKFFRSDASNLASFLYKLSVHYRNEFNLIEGAIKIIAPYFDKFILLPDGRNIELVWKEKGNDKYFNAYDFSDGTLRMICLITLLLQPKLPSTIIIDEPELGLHPTSINLLASLIKSVSKEKQIIISTQSVTLLNQFTPKDVIVVERIKNETVFRRITKSQLKNWLDDYSLGEVWEKNIIGGRP